MEKAKTELLSDEILRQMEGTEPGHCARVDFLDREEILGICSVMASQVQGEELVVRVLIPGNEDPRDGISITTGQAVELRNRKQGQLCLFVPTDLVDAAFSSLANSFALIDGRELHTAALRKVTAQLSAEARAVVTAVFSHLRGTYRASDDQKLDFVTIISDLSSSERISQAGLELWRVGLIPDARPNFVDFLDGNRRAVMAVSRPGRLTSTVAERVQGLGVDGSTAREVVRFFRRRSPQDVTAWQQALANGDGPTFDRWTFPDQTLSDLVSVTVRPFVNPEGSVEKYCHLQQDVVGGALIAPSGPKQKLTVKWAPAPSRPQNLGGWRVEIVPASTGVADWGVDLPSKEVPSSRQTTTFALDLGIEEPVDFPVQVQVTALDPAGNPIVKADTEEEISAVGDEFFLVPDTGDGPIPVGESRRTVPSLALGRLEAALEGQYDELIETQPQHMSADMEYFSVRLNERRVLNIGLSAFLHSLEIQILAEPRTGGRYVIDVDEVLPVGIERVRLRAVAPRDGELWAPFWRARENFFARVRKASPRDVIEFADWNPELASAAQRYGQACRDLVDGLIASSADREDLLDVLSLDSILVRIHSGNGAVEEAVVVLPTHPLRAAWLAAYTQLLRSWEEKLLTSDSRQRRQLAELKVIQSLEPANVPPVTFRGDSDQPFAYFRNLRFFYGVAFPAAARDPYRQFHDVATVLGMQEETTGLGGLPGDRLATHLARFLETHPYVTQTLVATLVNPGRGEMFASAVERLLQPTADDDATDAHPFPTLEITSFVEDRHRSDVRAVEQLRYTQSESLATRRTDQFLQGLSIAVKDMSALSDGSPPDAHVAVVADFSRPSIRPAVPPSNVAGGNSFSLHGLTTRLIPHFTNGNKPCWRYGVIAQGVATLEAHPAGPRYGEVLVDLQRSILLAGGKALGGGDGAAPVLEVSLDESSRRILERLHSSTDWVFTLDRFFALDYYDSSRQTDLEDVADKYLLDYSPDFAEGLGHRLMVTTTSRDEIASLLGRAMEELGFVLVNQSVGQLLHYLKTVSGRLAMQALSSTTSASAAVGLGVLTAWLQSQGRLAQAVLVPVDPHPEVFSRDGSGAPNRGERRCDLVLVGLRRNIVEAAFIEVKWRRGGAALESLGMDMLLQMEGSAEVMRDRFFDEVRIDGALQRSSLANVLRFYFERSRRYGLFAPQAEATFLDHLSRLEKSGLDFRASSEGYIVSLEDNPRKPFLVGDAKITLLTAHDFNGSTGLEVSMIRSSTTIDNVEEADRVLEAVSERAIEERDGSSAEFIPAEAVAVEVRNGESPGTSQDKVPSIRPEQESEAEDSVAIDVSLGTSSGVELGWKPSIQGSPHLFIIGIPGQGKSWTVARILDALSRQGIPSLVLDFHGQFSDPQEGLVTMRNATLLDAADGLPFSPFESTRGGGASDWKANSYALAEIFAYVAGLGDMQRDVVYTAVRDAYRARGWDNGSSVAASYPTLEEVLTLIEEKEASRNIPNVSARCRPLLEMDLFRPEASGGDLRSIVRNGLVIDLHNLYVEAVQVAAGAFVLRKLYKDMFQWGLADRLRLAIVLDEAHRLAKDITLPKIMKEGRKFGIAVIVASQGMSDFHHDILANSGTKVIFRTNYPESRKIAGFIRARQGLDLAARIEQLPVGHAYVQTPEMSFGSVIQMYPLIGK